MPGSTAQPLRVLYVEDDPALRGILASILGSRPELTIVAAVGNSQAALAEAQSSPVDVALLDLSLGEGDISGIELGLALRQANQAVGIVMLTQHNVPGFLTRIDEAQRPGWSFILKRADLQPGYLSDVLHSTARGLNVIDPRMVSDVSPAHALQLLSARQMTVMGLASEGLDTATIAARLGVNPAAARQELSRCYQLLVPDPPAGADLRTLAVLLYVRQMRDFPGRDA